MRERGATDAGDECRGQGLRELQRAADEPLLRRRGLPEGLGGRGVEGHAHAETGDGPPENGAPRGHDVREDRQRVYGRPDVAWYLLDDPWTRQDAERHVATRVARTDLDGEDGALAVVVEHDGTPVGDVTLWFTDRDRRVAEIGWVLDPEHGGRGLASEAVAAVLHVAFARYGLHRVTAQTDARNTASAALAARVGMHREAHFRQDWWSKGGWTDTLVFAVLATDPLPGRG